MVQTRLQQGPFESVKRPGFVPAGAGTALLLTGLLIAGCAQKPLQQAAVGTPDPFGYQKRSAVCTVPPVKKVPGGGLSATMAVRSDDGRCDIVLSQGDDEPYRSFVLTASPAHGKAFIYNHDTHTLVTYTASTAYAGPDHFDVALIQASGQPRVRLSVAVSADATGVVLPPPPVAAAPPPSTTTHKTTHTTRRKKKTTS